MREAEAVVVDLGESILLLSDRDIGARRPGGGTQLAVGYVGAVHQHLVKKYEANAELPSIVETGEAREKYITTAC